MTHPLETLEGQQAALIERLPSIQQNLTAMLTAEHSDDLFRVVSARLTSGINVFGHEMFTWTAGDLWQEATEELADAVLWFLAYLVVAENGPLPAVENPRHDDSPRAESGEYQPKVGDYVRVVRSVLGTEREAGRYVGYSGTVEMIAPGYNHCQVRMYTPEAERDTILTFWHEELAPTTDIEMVMGR